MTTTPTPGLTLHPLAGPRRDPFTIPGDGPASIGRAADSDLCLLDESVSRRHASIVRRAGQWHLLDVGSAGGTLLNGVRIPKGVPAPLTTGDVVRIGPWALRVVVGVDTSTNAHTIDDSRTQRVERANPQPAHTSRADQRLRLLIDCLAKLNSAPDDAAAARILLEPVLAGSGYARGAVLRRLDHGDAVEVLATGRLDPRDTLDIAYSRTLIERANAGSPVVLSGPASQAPGAVVPSNSISELQIHSAICVPIFLAASVFGYLYLDARGREAHVRPDVAGFCEAAATAYGLALANLKRADLERRQTALQAELNAAREVQQMLLPPEAGNLHFLRYAVHVRPGLFVAGDLFDILPLPDGIHGPRVAIALGDVAGHGVGSALMMGMTQSFLHAQLLTDPDPQTAASTLNRFLTQRATGGRFASLFLAVLHASGQLDYVDAGHGHCLLADPHGNATPFLGHGGVPVGVDPDATYPLDSLTIPHNHRLILYSDGLPEQRSPDGSQLGPQRLAAALQGSSSPELDVRRMFDAVLQHATLPILDDDATAASIQLLPTHPHPNPPTTLSP